MLAVTRPRGGRGIPRALVTLAVSLAVLSGCAAESSVDPRPPGAATDVTRVSASAVSRLQRALLDGDRTAAAAVGSGGARATLGAAVENIGALGVDALSLRFVEKTTLSADDLAAYGPQAWQGTVEIRYRIPGWDEQDVRLETPILFVPGGAGALIAAVGGTGGRAPLWLRGPLTVRTSGRALVLVRQQGADRYLTLANRALAAVAAVLPDWRGRLVIEVPATEEELDEALDASQEQYANIAAVTAAVDGSLSSGTPVHVFLNPRVFDGLGPRGAQVVMSHESTHVAVAATFAQMPIWLLEGFADYVALAHAGIPVRTAAAQILARVRRQGAPQQLPTEADLEPTANGLGATYEAAWLAARFIARRYGEAKLVAFYRAVDAGAEVGTAFRTVLGTTQESFVRAWSADVASLAGGEDG